MALKAIDHTDRVASEPLYDRLGLFVPDEYIAAIAAAHHVLRVWSKEIDTFDCFTVSESNIEWI